MEIDYETLTDLAGADGHCSVVPLIILDYLYVDAPWYKPRFIKNAVPERPRPVVYGIENPYLIPEFYDIPYLGPMHIVPSAFYGRKAIF